MNWAIGIAGGLVLGVGVPWLGVRMLVPAFMQGRLVSNYRGREVFLGLGVAWVLWAGCAILAGVLLSEGVAVTSAGESSVLPLLMLAGLLALVAFALGVVDDAYGSGDARGFRGHLSALAQGHLSTGGLKLVGISAASLIVAVVLSGIAPWSIEPGVLGLPTVGVSLIVGAAIALTSNFVNLTDLRPGRALKVYTLLAVVGALSTGLLLPALSNAAPHASRAIDVRALDTIVILVFVLGPVAATWRYDLGEFGMLGDAGANPMGAVAGMLIVAGLPLWGVAVYGALMLGLNLVSERVSFSRVIEGNAVLSWLDGLGRLPAEDSSAGAP